MTAEQKELINKLLSDCFMRKTSNGHGTSIYRLYDSKVNPIKNYRLNTVNSIEAKRHFKIFKKDKHGRITLHLFNVRRLHGKCYLKRAYKKLANEKTKS